MNPSYDLAACRREIPVLQRLIPLANCSHSPLTTATRQALDDYRDSLDRDVMNWDGWMEQVDGAKQEFAALIHAEPDEIAMAPSVTAAVASLASALPLQAERRRVVLSGAEFPSVGHVWLAREPGGVAVDWVPMVQGMPPALEQFQQAVDERTLLVGAAHAYYGNGALQDVAAIARLAHRQGALILVDAYQTLGVRPVDVRAMDIDFLVSGCHKFLMGIPGIAFLYVRRQLIPRLHPTLTGWFGRADIFAFDPTLLDWAPDARRFEMATPPVAAACAARAGMALIRRTGVAAIQEWVLKLSGLLSTECRARGLSISGPQDPAARNGVTALICPGDAGEIEDELRGLGVLAAARGQAIRLAPHYFTSPQDLTRALDALTPLLGSP
ncbi:MAG: aminotransferase class V-fold PLP-dependent enzyme [Acidobacteria bacterium]|nr:aminotransferase class V-fold PLP-dependent enzyme [Acidobacteriota bacterium]